MSAKITVIVYILICFEVGVLLLILPWRPAYWEDNFFLYFITSKLNAAWIPTLMTSGYVKGLVTGIGALNILAGLRDIFKFRESVASLAALGNAENDKESSVEPDSLESDSTRSGAAGAVALSDHRPPGVPPQS